MPLALKPVDPAAPGGYYHDHDLDGDIEADDFADCASPPGTPHGGGAFCNQADADADSDVDLDDFAEFQANFAP